ncbi:MBL fold metallo-hydrolase [Elizabethkingia anophelis]|uniref:MBL fold metallo-hydrolase n=1 Tax=Elizabethkingia anophelis TaxID=1117645 RepID=UPI001369034A|nr:MBL fold metallo-hydrolase [Elizabethkingia anophelis]MYY29513.1 MBL fold metallo-hydrolase [Elizabethkingia anophelis]HAY3506921.1 MBL fold metallo-hydrolase [Elizabethkingia anophelis]
MKVCFYNAGCGDAFRIEFKGVSGQERNVLIDSGYQRTFQNILSSEFKSIEAKGGNIDLCVLTHIHDDHIGGIETYVKAILADRANDIILKWWFNSPRPVSAIPKLQRSGSVAKSINQSDTVTSYLQYKNALPSSPIISNVVPYEIDGMKIYVLSPNETGLQRLRDKYRDPKIEVESIEDEKTSRAVAAKSRDYHKTVDEFDFTGWAEDCNIENGSSIALLTELNEKKILWLADAFPSVIVANLEALGYSESDPLVCDYVKVAHHGSFGNNGSKLFNMIKCQKYILSTDGYNLHGLPSKECLVQILNNPFRAINEHYIFYMTSNDNVLNTIFESDGENVYEKLNFELIYPINGSGFNIEF